ncbi:MAG: EAL domain-containing protein [Roseburia sp.]
MKILYFDIAAIIILVILTTSLFFRKMLSGRANKLLAVVLADVLLTTIFDLWSEAYHVWIPAKAEITGFRYFLYYGYFMFRNLTTPLYQLYLCAVTDTWHILRKKKWLQWAFVLPYLVICGTLISNLFCHKVFYLDENLSYVRGPLLDILYVASFVYLLYGVIYLLVFRKVLSTDKFIALIIMYPLNLVAIVIQMFVPSCLIEMFMTSVSLLLVTSVVQRPEEMINPILGIRNYIAYTSDMKKAFMVRKSVRIIFVKIVNYHSLFKLVGYDACNALMKRVSSNMKWIYAQEHLSMDIYYLENGEFALVAEREEPEKVAAVADRIAASTKEPVQVENLNLGLDACICTLQCPRDINSYKALLSFGNSFHTYLPAGGSVTDMEKESDRHMFQLLNELDGIIADAIANHRFEMYYQPIYSTREKRFLSAEALIRLKDEKYGFISPELFITAAERNGTILQIGDFVLDSVCGFLAECREKGLPIEFIEINLSMTQCVQKNLTEKVLFYLEKYHLKPEQINLEITETAANTAHDIVIQNIDCLTEKGIYFSLDDYGTGYSNITRIISLPFRIVKLDKSLADKIDDGKVKILLTNTVRMLKETGAEIVVEGVETEDALRQFVDMGCDYIQGYYFSKPLPEQEFMEFIGLSF